MLPGLPSGLTIKTYFCLFINRKEAMSLDLEIMAQD
jgi:hypothetical protein